MSLLIMPSILLATAGGGNRAAFTRGGWAGARYVGVGMSAEAMVDDVYAIYWNPAGLAELKGKKRLSPEEIRQKAEQGQVDQIQESDLIRFSEDYRDEFVFQTGMSASMLDVSRQTGFFGVAFNLGGGIAGVGGYSLISTGIDGYDASGNSTGDLSYVASAGYLSYGWSAGVAAFGISLKTVYERIDDTAYIGGGADIGTQIYVLPIIKAAFVIQDIGTGLAPIKEEQGIDKTYDLAWPTMRASVTVESDSGVTFAISGVGKLELPEEERYSINTGLRYRMTKNVELLLGLQDMNFTSGLHMKMRNMSISYAFAIDSVDYGYNNIASVTILF